MDLLGSGAAAFPLLSSPAKATLRLTKVSEKLHVAAAPPPPPPKKEKGQGKKRDGRKAGRREAQVGVWGIQALLFALWV